MAGIIRIDGTNLKTEYGLGLLRFNGFFSLPARKRVLDEPQHGAGDIVHEPNEVEIILFAKYADAATMETNLNNFKTFLNLKLKHAFNIPGSGAGWQQAQVSFTGVIKKGFETQFFRPYNAIKITFKAEVTI